jgi:DNA-binding transcriptional ArsR family regulator
MKRLSDEELGSAFGALSHEIRLLVLDVLERERGAETFGAAPVSYSELIDRTESHTPDGVAFDRSNSSYHLRVLRDAGFVSREAGGYRITQAGVRIVRAIRANIGTDTTFETVPIEEPCPYCGGRSVITLEDEWVFITCRDCPGAFAQEDHLPEGTIAGFQASPAAVQDRTPHELFRMAFRVGLQVHRLFAAGICPTCNATTTTELLELCPDHSPGDGAVCPSCGRTTDEFLAVSCDVCDRSLMTFPAIVVATDPAVIAALYERGNDVTDQTWAALSSPPDWPSEYVSTDPPVLQYTIPVPRGEPLRVRLDAGLNVTVRDG